MNPLKLARKAWRMARLQWIIGLVVWQGPSDQRLARLAEAWGNTGYAADDEFLQAACSLAVNARGPILECGSGVTTLAVAAVAKRRNLRVHSLEHHPHWARHVRRIVRIQRLPVHIHSAPLTNYGVFNWYMVPIGLPRRFDVVVCDGPPGDTRGGRYGLLPVLRDKLVGSTIILDDADRAGEQHALGRWVEEYEAQVHHWSAKMARVTVP